MCVWVDKHLELENNLENAPPTPNRVDVLSVKSGNHTQNIPKKTHLEHQLVHDDVLSIYDICVHYTK